MSSPHVVDKCSSYMGRFGSSSEKSPILQWTDEKRLPLLPFSTSDKTGNNGSEAGDLELFLDQELKRPLSLILIFTKGMREENRLAIRDGSDFCFDFGLTFDRSRLCGRAAKS